MHKANLSILFKGLSEQEVVLPIKKATMSPDLSVVLAMDRYASSKLFFCRPKMDSVEYNWNCQL